MENNNLEQKIKKTPPEHNGVKYKIPKIVNNPSPEGPNKLLFLIKVPHPWSGGFMAPMLLGEFIRETKENYFYKEIENQNEFIKYLTEKEYSKEIRKELDYKYP